MQNLNSLTKGSLLVFALILQFSSAFGQKLIPCDYKGVNAVGAMKLDVSEKSADQTYFVKVYAHALRTSSCNGGVSTQQVEDAVNRLNTDFNGYGIYFVWQDCGINNICNTSLYESLPDISSLNSTYGHSDGIDLFFGDPNFADGYGGFASGPGGSLVVLGSGEGYTILDSPILTHEMGHCLGLWHTHHGTETGDCELVGFEDDMHGDFCGDTKSDPYAYVSSANNCSGSEWTGNLAACVFIDVNGSNNPDDWTLEDENGTEYVPHYSFLQNYMSYYALACRNLFTPKQIARMKSHLATIIPGVVTNDYRYAIDMSLAPGENYCTNDVSQINVEVCLPAGQTSPNADVKFFPTISPPSYAQYITFVGAFADGNESYTVDGDCVSFPVEFIIDNNLPSGSIFKIYLSTTSDQCPYLDASRSIKVKVGDCFCELNNGCGGNFDVTSNDFESQNVMFYYDITPCSGNIVTGTSWNFGDGSSYQTTIPYYDNCTQTTYPWWVPHPLTGNVCHYYAHPGIYTVTVTVYFRKTNTTISCSRTKTFEINVLGWEFTGGGETKKLINERSNNSDNELRGGGFLAVYPTPTNGVLSVELENRNEQNINFAIYDAIGKLVMSNNDKLEPNVKNKFQLDVSSMLPGIYFLRVSDDSGLIGVKKILKD
ncbi:MAG: T9SS type A sorting domain-containing protein [Saprospiraceae bacterium]|nr:T9SS type A sorting domain-containing protein [Saprospiraceae bacterium]